MTDKAVSLATSARADSSEPSHGLLSDIKDGAVRLVHEAYENPRAQAVATAAAVATGALLLASHGKAARVLLNPGKDILLVEDTTYMGRAFKMALEEQNPKNRVTWVTGVTRATPLTGVTPEGAKVLIDPRKFDYAFVDGDLKGSYLQGEHVVDALRKSNLRSIGTSTIPELNKRMLINGASIVAEKPTVLASLANRSIDWENALNNPTRGKAAVDFLKGKISGESGKALRFNADQLLARAITAGGI